LVIYYYKKIRAVNNLDNPYKYINQINTIPSCFPWSENTPNTTVFRGINPFEAGAAVANSVWNDPDDPMKHPGAVILARGDGFNYQEALISSPLVHFPRNGPVLLTEPSRLNPITAQTLLRLRPTGKNLPAQVIVVGSLPAMIDYEVQQLGFTVCRINGGEPAATAALIWEIVGPKCNVILTSGETFEEALPAGGWAAHMGDPILLTCRNNLPMATAEAIRRKQPNVFILGSTKTIAAEVEEQVRYLTCGLVERISGRDPFEIAVNFTKYKSPKGDFGWGIKEKQGWSFRFSRYDDWTSSINGNPLSHMGKHSPLLLIHPETLPEAVSKYIMSVNPVHPEPRPPYMHGFIVGINGSISCPVQLELDDLLETVREMG
jgi:putative cell wall-binding protein